MGVNPWLPVGVRMGLCVLLAVALATHLGHLVKAGPHGRAWHIQHIFMAAGMIVMVGPLPLPRLSSTAAAGVFALPALGSFAFIGVDHIRGRGLGWRRLVSAIDLAAMAYMFVFAAVPQAWLTWLFIAWFGTQALGWACGRLGHPANLAWMSVARADLPADLHAGDSAGCPLNYAQTAHRPTALLAASLAFMALAMAYMFVAMQMGM